MKARAPLCALLALGAVGLAGCGNERPEPPDLTSPAAADPAEADDYETFDGEGVSFRFPKRWSAGPGNPPVLAQVGSGGASVTVYAYPRDDLPTDSTGVEASLDRVLESLRERAPGFLVLDTDVTEVDGSPAVEVRGRGTVSGLPVETRSVHVYKPEVEYVVDAFARPGAFAEANRIAFRPLLSSLELSDEIPVGEPEDEG